MGDAKGENQRIQCLIRVKNHLNTHWEHWFEGMKITQAEDGVTILAGEVVDQCALHGLLEKIYSLNLSLISIQTIDSEKGA